jgi:hypothetical protein
MDSFEGGTSHEELAVNACLVYSIDVHAKQPLTISLETLAQHCIHHTP